MEQAVCTEHQSPATGTCARCGAFLCPKCTWKTFCADCYRRGIPEEARVFRAQGIAQASCWTFLVSLFVLFITRGAGIVIAPLIWLGGIGVGVVALWVRRGAPGVITPALIGIALNATAMAVVLAIALRSS